MRGMLFRFIQISDIHLFQDQNGALLGVKTQDSFQAVIDLLKQEKESIHFILLSGDLSQDHSKSAYLRLADMLKPFHVPVYCIPGNHDDPKMMEHIYPCEPILNDKHIILKNWQIILLNSQKSGEVCGYLDEAQFKHLERCLKAYPKHHSIVVFHHHPMLVGCKWLDPIGLTNAGEFWKVIAKYANVHTVLFGHIHQEFEQKINNIPCYATPSTCIQFKRKHDAFALEKLPPGYRWVELYEDGSLKTDVKRTKEYVGVFDVDAKGY